MKITAYGKESGILMSLSNYVYNNNEGYEGSKRTFIETIKAQPFDVQKIADALNNTKNILKTFSVFSETDTCIILEAVDHLKNVDHVKISMINDSETILKRAGYWKASLQVDIDYCNKLIERSAQRLTEYDLSKELSEGNLNAMIRDLENIKTQRAKIEDIKQFASKFDTVFGEGL